MILIKFIKIILSYKKWMLLGLLFMLLTIASGIGLMTVGAFLITLAATQVTLGALQLSILGVRFFGTSRGFFRYFERLITHNCTFKLLKEYKVYFYRKIEPYAPAILHKYDSADLLKRLVCDIENLNNIYIRFLLPLLSLISLIIASLFLSCISSKVALAVVFILISGGLIIPLINYVLSEKYHADFSLSQTLMGIETLDTIQGFDDIKLFSQTSNFKNRLLCLGNNIKQSQKKLYFLNAVSSGGINLLFSLSLAMIIYFLAVHMKNETNGTITIAVFAIGFMALYEIIQSMISAFQKLGPTMQSVQKVHEITRLAKDATATIKTSSIPNNYDIKFSNVSFKYSEEDLFELKHLNLTVRHKECIFIIGPSGCGKSSLINLIMTFYKPSHGTISIGETDINDIGQYLLPSYIGICEQKSHIFNDTFIDNLCLSGKPHSQQIIEKALALAKANDFINLNFSPKEKGIKLSSGEQKRLSIARSILSDAPIMVFDEPFANLDNDTANVLSENLTSLKATKTVIIITHTLPVSFKKADRIIIMNDGRIEVEGSPDELEKKRDPFYLKCKNYA